MGANSHPTTVPESTKKQWAKETVKEAGLENIQESDTLNREFYGKPHKEDSIFLSNNNFPEGWGITDIDNTGSSLYIGVGRI